MAASELVLKRASREQIQQTWANAYDEWGKGTMKVEDFLQRERVLAAQDFAQRGLTVWVYVPRSDPATLEMRAHLESFCRRAIVRRRGAEAVEEVTCHSVGTVFCPPTQRNRGYATGLMRALAQELQELQGVSNLYSDIGAEFYARHGWHVYSPVSVRFTQALPSGAAVKLLGEPEIVAYAEQDCGRVVQQMQALPVSASHVRVAILPEACVYAWHFARARFECSIVHGSDHRLEHFGAALADGSFLAWTYDVRQGTVVVLRAAVESQESLLALTAAAMEVGRKVGFTELVFWNPPFEQALIAAGAERVVRTGSLPSLCVFGEEDGEHVEWLLNEKLPWV